MENKHFFEIFLRYTIPVILGIPNLFLFYAIFTPLTLYPAYYILNFLYQDVNLLPNNLIGIGAVGIKLIPACIAATAYYLLLVLNLTTPMKIKTRIYSLLFLFITFLILNIARILIFAHLALIGYQYFDISHSLTWYFGSTLLIVIIWFADIKLFKIKAIPVHTDLKNVIKEIRK